MDFGLAKVAGTTKLTRTGTTMGTVAYMSPEQVKGMGADARSDLWALGVVLYEMVSGRVPFGGEYEAALLYSILNEDPEPLAREGRDIPAGLDGIIAKALAKDPAKRYQRAEEFVADVQMLAQDREALPAGKARPARGFRRLWRSWRPWQRGVAVGALVIITAGLVWSGLKLWPGGGEVIDSIGFIPLQNLSGDAKGELWADGVTERLSASMGTVGALKKIVSDQTMKQFKGSKDPLPVIGRKVGVKALVEGSLMLVGDQVQITVKLCEASKDRQIWSNTFNGAASDIMVLQSQIVRAIAEKLQAKLTPQSEAQLAAAKPVNQEVYSAYLKGVRENNDWNLKQALEQFQHALRIDPDFAPGYAGMAFSYVDLVLAYEMHPDEAAPLARAAAARAVQLDDNSAEAHAALGFVKLNFDYDCSGAESEYNRALAINPNDGFILWTYGLILMIKGKREEAYSNARRIDEMGWGDLTWVAFYTRRYDEAIARELKGHVGGSPPPSGDWLLCSYVLKGRYEGAMQICAIKEASPDFRDGQWPLGFVGWAYGASGRRDKALGVLNRLRELEQELEKKGKYFDPYNLAIVYAGLGDRDQAFASIRKGIEIRSPVMIQIVFDPLLDNLHTDPRWQEVLQLLHYPKKKL
jgi:TolB-like protein